MEKISKMLILESAKMFKNYVMEEIERNEIGIKILSNLEKTEENLSLETKEMIYKISKLHNILIARLEDLLKVYEEFFEE